MNLERVARVSSIIAHAVMWIAAICYTMMSLSRGAVGDAYIAGFLTATIMMATIVFIAKGGLNRDE